MRNIVGASVLALCTAGCIPPFDGLFLDSKALMRIHVPPRAQVGQPFKLFVDLDRGCSEFRQVTVTEDAQAKTIAIDAMVKRPGGGQMCPGGIVLERHDAMARASSTGTYTISFKGYVGRASKTLEVVDAAVSEWAPPAFDAHDANSNY